MRRIAHGIGVLCLAGAVTGCGPQVDNNRVRVVVLADDDGDFKIGRTPLDTASAVLRAGVAQGLVSFGPDGEIRPGLARRWIVTNDGSSYIFRLGEGTWNDGGEITAHVVARTLKQRFGELRKGRFADDIEAIDDVVAMTNTVIEVRLNELRPSLLNLLAQPEFGLVYKGVGSGPMKAARHGRAIQLRHRALDETGAEKLIDPLVLLSAYRPAEAISLFADHDADLVLDGRFQHLPVLGAAKLPDSEIRLDPMTGLFGLLVTNGTGFLSDTENRAAIAMAIDRPRLLALFEMVVWRESTTISPPEMQNRARIAPQPWMTLDSTDRITEARERVAAWVAANGTPAPLRIAMPAGAGARVLYVRIKADLAKVGLETERVGLTESADLRLIDEVSDYDSPSWYISRLSCRQVPVCSTEADAALATARQAPNMAERTAALGEAEKALADAGIFVPVAMPLRFSLVRNGLSGFQVNYRGWHLLQFLGAVPD